jgi:anti-sigma B factor antagonist
MELREETFGNVKVFHLGGKIMGGPETQEMCDHLRALIAAGTQSLVMNFQDVQWINSTGIGAIISCLTTLRNRGGDVIFANLHGATQRYFEITKLEKVVKIFDNIDEAVASFTSA